MDNNWQVCSLVVQAKASISTISPRSCVPFPVAKLPSAMWKVVS